MTADLSPQAKRALLEQSYADSYKHAGVDVSREQVAAQVLADLELVDAVDRAGELRHNAGPIEVDREKPQEIIDAERETSTRLLDDSNRGEVVRTKVLDASALFSGERWALAGGRIARIVEGVAPNVSNIRKACESAAVPHLARDYVETWWFFMNRFRPSAFNPFYGMSEVDAARLLVRKVEDICDRSTGKLGPWYVK